MKILSTLFAFLFTTAIAFAGMAPMWADYSSLNRTVSKQLEDKKGKLSKAQYDKYAAALKDGYTKMEVGVGRMLREDYYKMGDVEFKKVRQIRDELEAK